MPERRIGRGGLALAIVGLFGSGGCGSSGPTTPSIPRVPAAARAPARAPAPVAAAESPNTAAAQDAGGKTITLSASTTSFTEGDSGVTEIAITVTLGEAVDGGLVVNMEPVAESSTGTFGVIGIAGGCDTPDPTGADMCWPKGTTVTIAPGETTATFTFGILGDTDDGSDVTLTFKALPNDAAEVESWTAGTITVTVVDDDGAPAAPAGLAAAAGDRQVTLAWDESVNASITSWQVRQQTGADDYGDWTVIPESGMSTSRHVVTGLTNGLAHAFQVRARNGAIPGADSVEVKATPDVPPCQIEIVDATGPSSDSSPRALTVHAGIPIGCGDLDALEYQMKTADGTWGDGEWAPTEPIPARPDDPDEAGDQPGSLVLPESVVGLRELRIRALNGDAAGPPSDATGVWIGPPGKPTGLAATAGDGSVTLGWNAAAAVEKVTGWEVQQKIGSGSYGSWTVIDGSGAPTTTHTITNLGNDTVHGFRIRARADATGGIGAASDEVTATPVEAIEAAVAGVTISTPTLTVVEGGAGTYTVALNAEPSADVSVTVGGASGDVTVAGSPLTFTPANYATPQTVTVSAAEDEDATADPDVVLTHGASGGGYDSVTIGSVTVTVTENDEAGGG